MASRSLIAGPLELLAAINSALLGNTPAAHPDNSPAPVRDPNTLRALDLQDLVDRVVHRVDVLDLAHAPASVLHGPAALAAHDLVLAALRPLARHRARSAHRRIALGAVDSSIRRRRKAQ